ncbi:transposable element Tc3 transposase [Trichonephila clavipes]|nr:transposable element Tc3 transposase [Trichonephila clavipes]
MVWAGIMINGHTRLHVFANGTMTGQRYIDEVLLPHVRLFRGAVGDKFVFMDDNATCHRTLAVQDCLDSEGIQRLVWPARSPDLNPIENVWDALGRQVAGRNYPSTNKNTLIRALTEEWDKLPQQLLDNVVQNFTKECLNRIISDRKELELRAERDKENQRIFELQKLQTTTDTSTTADSALVSSADSNMPKLELHKLLPIFDPKTTDVPIFLDLFERQLTFLKVPVPQWVMYLVGL